MTRRKADFIQYPGSGMWMLTHINSGNILLYRNLPIDHIKEIVKGSQYRIFWIDQGAGAYTLLKIREGGTSASATEVTPRILVQYLKE